MNLFWARVSTPSVFFSPVPYSNAIEWFGRKVTVPEIVLISAKLERSAVLHIVGQKSLLIPLVHIHPCSTLYLLHAPAEIFILCKNKICVKISQPWLLWLSHKTNWFNYQLKFQSSNKRRLGVMLLQKLHCCFQYCQQWKTNNHYLHLWNWIFALCSFIKKDKTSIFKKSIFKYTKNTYI